MDSPNAPLRLSKDRVILYGAVLVILGFLPLVLFPNVNGNHWHWSTLWESDWSYFVGGGATVGSPDLLGPRHAEWETAHGFVVSLPWAYPPAFAWIFAPFAHMPLSWGFWINAVTMLGACVASGIIGARIYGLSIGFAIFAVLAWEPAVVSIPGGQNASLALLLAMGCVYGLARGKWILAGASVGLLLFKPTDAAVFVLLLLLRREWRALAVVGGFAFAWYFASVPATAGDWNWPYVYAASLHAWYPHQQFSEWLISTSALAMRLGLPATVANGICLVLIVAWGAVTLRVSLLEAASFAGLLAISTSTHANPHEAALLLPAIFYVMTRAREPWRSWIVALAYLTGGVSICRWFIGFDPVALLVTIGTVCYLAFRLIGRDRQTRALPASKPVNVP